jgi:glycerate kinase
MVPGIELIKELANFNMQIQDSDWIITGEGKLDEQTKSGKTIQGILNSAGENTQIAAFCGKIDLSKKEYQELGIRFASEVMSKAIDFEDALENTAKYVTQLAEDFAKSFSSIK